MIQGKFKNRRHAFSLIELVIVVVIIGIIGAIAIPRISRGSAGAADSKLVADLAVLRNAIDLYATEHNGAFPAAATLDTQLTQYTDIDGATKASPDSTHIYGPYIRKMPTLLVGSNKGQSGVADASSATLGAGGAGWFYSDTTGEITANLAAGEGDATGKDYNTY